MSRLPDSQPTPNPQASESNLERYERLAEEFHRSTGMMAPGKDSPSNDPGEHTWQERSTAWTWWRRGYGCAERARSDQRAGAGEWVSVRDREPERYVDVYTHNGEVGSIAAWNGKRWINHGFGGSAWRPTHWLPITALPKPPTHSRGLLNKWDREAAERGEE